MVRFLLFFIFFVSLPSHAVVSEIVDYVFDESNCNSLSYQMRGEHLIIHNWDIERGNYECLFKRIKPFKKITIGVGNGGHMMEAHKIADEIKKRHISVGVHKSCVSACTFIAAASDSLKLCKYTQIGIHHYGVAGQTVDNPEVTALHYQKMINYGIVLEPYKIIFENTPHNRMHNLSFQEMKNIGFNPVYSKNCS